MKTIGAHRTYMKPSDCISGPLPRETTLESTKLREKVLRQRIRRLESGRALAERRLIAFDNALRKEARTLHATQRKREAMERAAHAGTQARVYVPFVHGDQRQTSEASREKGQDNEARSTRRGVEEGPSELVTGGKKHATLKDYKRTSESIPIAGCTWARITIQNKGQATDQPLQFRTKNLDRAKD